MEYYAMALVSFAFSVYAYLLGTRHGMSVSKGRATQPIREVINTIKDIIPKPPEEPSAIEQIQAYDYESALQAVKKEHLEGRR